MNMNRTSTKVDLVNLNWLLATGTIIAYVLLPWILTKPVSLSFGAYDLAEWASLHPEVRAMSLLFTSLSLRLLPALLIVFIALHIWPGKRIALAIIILVGGLALLPPLEYFSFARGDGNYQQQFAIAIITLLTGGICLSPLLTGKQRKRLQLICALLLLVFSIIGFVQGYNLLQAFGLEPQIGSGFILFATGTVLMIGRAAYAVIDKQNR